jgi:hypothetical protein
MRDFNAVAPPTPRDPSGEAEESPVVFDVAEAGGLEELGVPVGGEGFTTISQAGT